MIVLVVHGSESALGVDDGHDTPHKISIPVLFAFAIQVLLREEALECSRAFFHRLGKLIHVFP